MEETHKEEIQKLQSQIQMSKEAISGMDQRSR